LNPTLTLIYPTSTQAKLFKAYIELELQLGAIERVRKLYQKFLEWAPETCAAWCKFAELERDLNEKARARARPGAPVPCLHYPLAAYWCMRVKCSAAACLCEC